jgi:hypothetical protein
MRTLFLSARAALLWCLVLLLPGCIDPYMPDAISSTRSYLVVDGFINSRGSTTILLSRTFDIASKATPPIETKATVYIEEEGGTRYNLPESAVKGTYTSANLTLNPIKNYRLHILTSTNKDYASDFAPVKNTPPVDNITWRPTNDGLTIYVSSHDDTKQTQYYRWECEETWEIVPIYRPSVEYRRTTPLLSALPVIAMPYPTTCWGSAKTTDIKITNTLRLSQDVVSNFPVRSFATTANQLTRRYSILVKQYAQTADEYQYWELLKKNTENIGTLFDPLPAQLTGNIHCLNDQEELALGYVGVHTMEQKRLFINRGELPTNWSIRSGYESCAPTDTVFLVPPGVVPPPTPAQVLLAAFGGQNYLPIDEIKNKDDKVIGYTAKSRDCIDCRTRGTAVKPSFWP